ncbi:hypothetical protein [Pararhizobium haloflavum]|nr:hypothetical protein [Pararhizobium haloflavum]
MRELLHLARQLRRDSPDPLETFAHRLRVGVVAALIILLALSLR